MNETEKKDLTQRFIEIAKKEVYNVHIDLETELRVEYFHRVNEEEQT